MKETKVPDFIAIDDDAVNNLISIEFLQMTIADANIKTFTNPKKALAYIVDHYAQPDSANVIIFLDINMPVLSGWEVLDELEHVSPEILRKTTIYMLSSSIDEQDKLMAEKHPLISGYIPKYLSQEKILAVMHAMA